METRPGYDVGDLTASPFLDGLKALDLFSCCGGAGQGLKDGGFDEVVGVDITPGHEYPFEQIIADVFTLSLDFLRQFNFIWASPPCQFYTLATAHLRANGKEYPDLVALTRDLLIKTGKPFVIENTNGAPIRRDLMLCGEMFGLRVLRHRYFEINGFQVAQPKHIKHKPQIDAKHSYYMCVAGKGGNSASYRLDDWRDAMRINWISQREHLTQAIPPAYSAFIAKAFLGKS